MKNWNDTETLKKKINMEVQKFCDYLVYQYLIENEHFKTAQLLKDKRRKLYTLECKTDLNISLMISKYYVRLIKTISNTLVYDYWYQFGCGISKMVGSKNFLAKKQHTYFKKKNNQKKKVHTYVYWWMGVRQKE